MAVLRSHCSYWSTPSLPPMPSEIVRHGVAGARFLRTRRNWIPVRVLSASVACFALQACDGYDCVQIVAPSMRITVLDSITLQPPTIRPNFRVTNAAGTVMETQPSPSGPSFDVSGGVGVYSMVVGAVGYEDFVKAGVQVSEAKRCGGAQTVYLTAKLARMP